MSPNIIAKLFREAERLLQALITGETKNIPRPHQSTSAKANHTQIITIGNSITRGRNLFAITAV